MRYLAITLLLLSGQVLAGPKLYVFDCGMINFQNLEMFNLKDDESNVRQMFVPCYLIEHPKGRLFFDGGLPKNFADADGPVAIEGGSVVYQRWIMEQLGDMGLGPTDINHVAYSHLHFDHAGTGNTLAKTNVIMQQKEWDAAFSTDPGFVDPALISGLKNAKVTFIDGDYDVFGDGSVHLIFTPGHTPGHQVLMVDLDNTGQLLISGDLYHTRASRKLRKAPLFNTDEEQTHASMDRVEQILKDTGATLWIEHDKALADTLKKAPQYYD